MITGNAPSSAPLRTQSKMVSAVEALVNTGVGFGVSIFFTAILWGLYHIPATFSQTMQITGWMTLISVIRGYVLRRLFNSEFWNRWKRS